MGRGWSTGDRKFNEPVPSSRCFQIGPVNKKHTTIKDTFQTISYVLPWNASPFLSYEGNKLDTCQTPKING